METSEENKYEVIITDPAEVRFFEILGYLYDNYPIDRAEVISEEIRDTAKTLKYQVGRGTPEPHLSHRKENYRFILYKRTSRADVKIIYYIAKGSQTVYVTDFFPTEKEDGEISERNT